MDGRTDATVLVTFPPQKIAVAPASVIQHIMEKRTVLGMESLDKTAEIDELTVTVIS